MSTQATCEYSSMGNNVRRRKSRRKARISSTKYGQKLKKKQTKKYHFELDILKDKWDYKKTLKQNLESLGLAYDSNAAIPIRKEDQSKDEIGDLADYVMATDGETVVRAVGEDTSTDIIRKKSCISRSEAKFIGEMIKSYGINYKGMARDSRNYNQLTETQIKKKCVQYLSSRHNKSGDKESTN